MGSICVAVTLLAAACVAPSAANRSPTADAGSDFSVAPGALITLDGSGSSDLDGDVLTFEWRQIAGLAVELTRTDTQHPIFTAPDFGATLVFRLTISDTAGGINIDTVTVTVGDGDANQPPTADAGNDRAVDPGEEVLLDGTDSFDPDGDPLLFAWVQTYGTPVVLLDAESVSAHFFAPDGNETFSFELTVDDGGGNVAVDTVIVIVGAPPPNRLPMADAGDDQEVDGGDVVTLDGSRSSDPDGDPTTFTWIQIDGSMVQLSGNDPAIQFFVAPGFEETLTFELMVEDVYGGVGTDTINVIVGGGGGNLPPVADAGPNQEVMGRAEVTLNGAASHDPNGDTLGFLWVQTAGPPVELTGIGEIAPTFAAPNVDDVLLFELTVNDGNGRADSDTIAIDVTRVPPRLYVANLFGDSIVNYADFADLSGNVAPTGRIAGPQSLLHRVADIVVTRDEVLIAADSEQDRLTVYADASSLEGDPSPIAVVQGDATRLAFPSVLAINHVDELLFVANAVSDEFDQYEILVFSTANGGLDGNVPPVRAFTSQSLVDPFGMHLTEADELYVVSNGNARVLVFNNASARSGTILPDRVIGSPVFLIPDQNFLVDGITDVVVDDADNLVVLDSAGLVHRFANASSLDGLNTEPDFTLTVSGAVAITSIALDAEGTAFISDFLGNAIYTYERISQINQGDHPADATISGFNTQLFTPIRLFHVD